MTRDSKTGQVASRPSASRARRTAPRRRLGDRGTGTMAEPWNVPGNELELARHTGARASVRR